MNVGINIIMWYTKLYVILLKE